MPDREKVISALMLCANCESCRICPYSPIGKPPEYNCGAAMAADALALLLEQEPVIRCKDCKHRFNGCCYDKNSERINFGVYVSDDWFCANGERQ